MALSLPSPQLQVEFSAALEEIRGLYLHQALSEAVAGLDVAQLDAQLAKRVPKRGLSALASHGLRGELVFPVPYLLAAAPNLLGYYRLLLGFSQKAFYSSETGLTGFRAMEEGGSLPLKVAARLDELCDALIGAGAELLDGIGTRRITRDLLEDLALLTVGPQLRGGHSNRLGAASIHAVFAAIKAIVAHAVKQTSPGLLELENAAKRRVWVEVASDPDVVIREELGPGEQRQVIAIEVKGGADFSNIHNRLGEAEKSHQKARRKGYHECWTVVNVDKLDVDLARKESPSSNRFYKLADLKRGEGEDFADFRRRILSLTNVKEPARRRR